VVAAGAGEASRIERRDGRIMSGEVGGFADGRNLVESPALGRITLEQAGIRPCSRAAHPAARMAGMARRSWSFGNR
jgi:hypothetical protein